MLNILKYPVKYSLKYHLECLNSSEKWQTTKVKSIQQSKRCAQITITLRQRAFDAKRSSDDIDIAVVIDVIKSMIIATNDNINVRII